MVSSTRQQVAIVGGGLAGLSAAAYLARQGQRVTLFERSESPGGRAATVEKARYFHNLGPHALYGGSTGVEVLQELGIQYTGSRPNLRGVAIRGGKAFTLPVGGRSLMTTRLFGMRSRVEAGSQLMGLRKGSEDHRTVETWLRDDFAQPAARDYVEALVRLSTYSNAPDVISVADAARQFAHSGEVLYLDGGWQTLVNGLAAAATTAGAEIRTGARVATVLGSGRVRGLRLADGTESAADAVVLALPPAVASELANGNEQLASNASSAIPAHAACLDIGLSKLPNPRRTFGLGIDAPFYLSTHSLFAKLAPNGKTMVSVAKYLPLNEPRDAERDLRELEAFLDLVQPGWRAFEEHRQYLPNMMIQSALPRADREGIAGRPRPEVEGADGLFVAGDWVGSGGWLADGTLGSGREAARAVAGWLAKAPAMAGVAS